MQRASGVLLHISSLPSKFNFGSMGKEAYEFVDFLSASGFKLWQILPLNPTNESGSPFQSYSVFAGNISLLDLTPYLTKAEQLAFLKESETFHKTYKEDKSIFVTKMEEDAPSVINNILDNGENNKAYEINVGNEPIAFCEQIDFEKVYNTKLKYLRKIFDRDKSRYNLEAFKKKNSFWLEDYAIYCVLRDIYSTPYWKFGDGLNNPTKKTLDDFKKINKKQIDFYIFIQFLFFKQWEKLKKYANGKGIKMFGDIAFYPSCDSCDIWANRADFCFDSEGKPKGIAGVPPDYFSKNGQVWGSPVYNIENMKKNYYRFWTKRIEHAYNFFDIVRLDHFRGFEAFWVVNDYKSTNAKKGKWVKSLGLDFFKNLQNKKSPILVAEDLGIITKDVKKLIDKLNIAGMKVFQFAFDGNPKNSYFPHNYNENCVAYLGTHDNNTFIGFLEKEIQPEILKTIKNYLGQNENVTNTQLLDMAFSVLLNSRANTVILTMQDILYLGSEYRMNIPATTHNNWCFRLNNSYNTDMLRGFLLKLNISANRT